VKIEEVPVIKVNRTKFWSNEKVIKYFLLLAKHSIRPGINWRKFRAYDKKGIFADFSNNQLTMFHKRLVRDNNAYTIQQSS
jgi:hypothetical protein